MQQFEQISPKIQDSGSFPRRVRPILLIRYQKSFRIGLNGPSFIEHKPTPAHFPGDTTRALHINVCLVDLRKFSADDPLPVASSAFEDRVVSVQENELELPLPVRNGENAFERFAMGVQLGSKQTPA